LTIYIQLEPVTSRIQGFYLNAPYTLWRLVALIWVQLFSFKNCKHPGSFPFQTWTGPKILSVLWKLFDFPS
jgi:hypothetical protein